MVVVAVVAVVAVAVVVVVAVAVVVEEEEEEEDVGEALLAPGVAGGDVVSAVDVDLVAVGSPAAPRCSSPRALLLPTSPAAAIGTTTVAAESIAGAPRSFAPCSNVASAADIATLLMCCAMEMLNSENVPCSHRKGHE